jgi:hypothetical protein
VKRSPHRIDLATRAYEQFGFHDTRGQAQIGGCLKALRELECASHFVLPAARVKPEPSTPRRLSTPLPFPVNVPPKAGDVEGLKLVWVQTPEDMKVWNELMIEEHSLGAGPLVGRQLRYLIDSDHGWLGGFGFAAPALQLADRDRWIGWDSEQRRTYLHYVAGMSRFLIRPSVQCHNLASKVMSLSALADNFEQK